MNYSELNERELSKKMNSFVENRFVRESVISSPSIDSIYSQLDKIENQSNLEEKISSSKHFLFLGPLILFLILLISGIILFIIVQQYTDNENDLKEIENSFPVLCPFRSSKKCSDKEFSLNERDCGLNRSSIFEIFYENNLSSIKPGDKLLFSTVINPPKIKINWKFLSKISSKSFLLILIDPELIPFVNCLVILHWIRYFPSKLESEEDICSYQIVNSIYSKDIEKIFLLYATNSTEMIIRAKTICNKPSEPFQLDQYRAFIQLKLIASTHFFIPTIQLNK